MRAFDPSWFLMQQQAWLRRAQRRLGRGREEKLLRGAWKSLQDLSLALVRLLSPRARNPWFTDEEARAVNQERAGLLKALSGWAQCDALGSKLHSGTLSPGCAICRDGYWDCNHINGRCTGNCFYCPQDHSMETEVDSTSDGFRLKSADEHVAYLKRLRFRGVGFSGGEPLLVLERLLSHLAAIRREFGPSIYLWMYTNGDLVDRETLKRLKEAGLDEIRFNVSTGDYDLSRVALARDYIPAVTVEIPAIPEDLPVLKKSLAAMQTLGVSFLNLHQMVTTQYNWRAFSIRPYHYSCEELLAVHESELCALRLLLHAREQQLHLPIHYCSLAYKLRFQRRGRRMRNALPALEGFQEITDAGYIRTLWVSDSADRLEALGRRMEIEQVEPRLWKLDRTRRRMALHRTVMSHVDWASATFSVEYLDPQIAFERDAGGFGSGNLKVHLRPVQTTSRLGRTSFECWRRLYVLKEAPETVFESVRERAAMQLRSLAGYEALKTGLPEIV
jgi:uncharacterized protein